MTARTPTLLLCLLASGCGTLSRLSEIGRPPEMTATADPTKEPIYRPLTMPMPAPQVATPQDGALWRSGSRAFFKDQRAAQVGDILTVLVNMTDAADVIDNTTSSRTGSEAMGLPNLFGLEASVPKMLAGAVASSLISANSTNSNNGAGEIKRNETVTLRVAGVITQVLPNGNLVVAARQEFRVNSELRQLQVTGVVRPQDIASDNTVIHDRMAEARISYGGRGQLTDLQTPRWGQQVIDTLAPF
jgi:flagellar L-ring protein precursor FlgH